MNNSARDSASRSIEEALAKFGEPEAEYRPAPGQTFLGVIAGVIIGALGFAGTIRINVGYAIFCVAGFTLAYWLWRLRKWRLMICPGGVIQARAWKVDAVAWDEIAEVVEDRNSGSESPFRVTFIASSKKLVVMPANRACKQLFQNLLAAAQEHGIAIRIEWHEHTSS